MAGRGSKRAGGQRRTSKTSGGSRGRKPAVSPIIDLEATIVDESGPAASAADKDPPKVSQAGTGPAGAEPNAASPNQDGMSGQEGSPEWWMKEMKTFFLGGVHIGRWRIPAAGSFVVLGIFAGGLVLGHLWGPDPRGAPGTGQLQERIAALETTLRGTTTANEALTGRFTALEGKLDKATEHSRNARAAADAALSEVRSMEASLQDLVQAGSNSDATGVSDAALRQQLTDLAARIEQLAQRAPPSDGAVIPEAVDQRIDAMAKALAELKASIDQSAARAGELTGSVAGDAQALVEATQEKLRGDLAAIEARLNDRLKALENSFTGSVTTEPAEASVAAGRLQRAVDSGVPFQRELSGLATALPGDRAITILAPYAAAGVPTTKVLTERFDVVAGQLTNGAPDLAAPQTDGGGDFVADVLSRVSKLVEVRKTAEPGSRNMRAAVKVARARVMEGDLGGAANALSGLADGLTEDAAKWIEHARARAEVDAAMAELLRRAIMTAPEPEDS